MSSEVVRTTIFIEILFLRCIFIAGGSTMTVYPASSLVFDSAIRGSSGIHSSDGVPVDLSYNEKMITVDNSSDVIPSAPGCPPPIGDLPWVYYGNPPRCFLVGTTGPCSPGQLLFGKEPFHGHCDCLCSPEIMRGSWNGTYGAHPSNTSRFQFCSMKDMPEMNDAVYDKQQKTCYYFDMQGPCRQGEWLVRDNKFPGDVTCVPQCTPETGPFHSSMFYNWQSGKCEQKPYITNILPVTLAAAIPQGACEDGLKYSRTLRKCITKSKAFLMFM